MPSTNCIKSTELAECNPVMSGQCRWQENPVSQASVETSNGNAKAARAGLAESGPSQDCQTPRKPNREKRTGPRPLPPGTPGKGADHLLAQWAFLKSPLLVMGTAILHTPCFGSTWDRILPPPISPETDGVCWEADLAWAAGSIDPSMNFESTHGAPALAGPDECFQSGFGQA